MSNTSQEPMDDAFFQTSDDLSPTGAKKLAALAEILEHKLPTPKKTRGAPCEFTAADRHVHQVVFGRPAP